MSRYYYDPHFIAMKRKALGQRKSNPQPRREILKSKRMEEGEGEEGPETDERVLKPLFESWPTVLLVKADL